MAKLKLGKGMDLWDPKDPESRPRGIIKWITGGLCFIFARRKASKAYNRITTVSEPRQPHQRKTPSGKRKTCFYDLPGELRNYIYDLSTFPFEPAITAVFFDQPGHMFRSFFQHSIFRVSKQVRIEAISYFCATKEFQMVHTATAATFLKYIGVIGRVSLTNIKITVYGFNNDPNDPNLVTIGRLLTECTNLRTAAFEFGMRDTGIHIWNRKGLAAMASAFQVMHGVNRRWVLRMKTLDPNGRDKVVELRSFWSLRGEKRSNFDYVSRLWG